MFWITENHVLFVGLFGWGNAETQTFSDGFALAESRTRKSGTVAPLVFCESFYICLMFFLSKNSILIDNFTTFQPFCRLKQKR